MSGFENADNLTILVLGLSMMGAGLLGGLLAGLLGVGGGIVIVPVLYHIFTLFGVDEAIRIHLAVGTSLATIIPTSVVSARAHFQKGATDVALLKRIAPGIVAGVLIGSTLAVVAGHVVLTAVFAVVAGLVAVNMASPGGLRLADQPPAGAGIHAVGASIGGFSTLMGLGGGTLGVPILSAFGFPVHRAVGTAAAFGVIISIPGTIGFLWSGMEVAGRPPFSVGYVNLLGFAAVVPVTIIAAPWGAAIAHAISPTLLRRAFALFLALTSARMMWGLLG